MMQAVRVNVPTRANGEGPLAAPEAGALPQKPRLGSASPQYGQENLFRAVASGIAVNSN